MEPMSLSETVYGSAAGTSGASMFSTMMPYFGMAYMAYGIIKSGFDEARQKRQQRELLNQQKKQATLLREKIIADKANLYSAVQSSVAQTSGAMGAIY